MSNLAQDGAIVLIDLSSIAYPIWHTSQSDPNPNKASEAIVARVRALVGNQPAAICCDGGRSFRKDLAATYKANRTAAEAPLQHQIHLAKEQLEADGFPVWTAPGFEADDIIASAAARLGESHDVIVVSADKDLLQLVGGRVSVKNATTGDIFDSDAVGNKFGVLPGQMRDYLTLVGDASDNVTGAKSIGPKTAADLLARFGSLDTLYQRMDENGAAAIGLKPAVTQSLREFKPNLDLTRQLVTLRVDVELPLEELNRPRVPKEAATFHVEDESEPDHEQHDAHDLEAPAVRPDPPKALSVVSSASAQPDAILPAPADWERGLDPRSMRDARQLALDMHQSRMFSAYGSPQGVLSTIMVGRELGLPAMASLRSIHNIEGRHGLSASLMVALVLKSGLAEYFEPVEFDREKATFVTKRHGARNEVRLTHTIEDARIAGLLKPDSNWVKVPGDMLIARCQSRLCRMIYPDLLAGLYTPEELHEMRQAVA